MPRMRTLKPEACTSETLATVPRAYRWTFATFWTHCDDSGRAVWNPRLIKAAIYPLDDDVTLNVLEQEFAELERIGAVCFYDVDGKRYVHVPAWSEHQHPNRPQASRLPPCPKTDHSCTTDSHVTDDSVNAHGALIPVVVEEGLVEVSSRCADGAVSEPSPGPAAAAKPPKREIPKSLEAAFDEFWSVYPRKRGGKAEAERKFTLAARRASPERIIEGARRFAAANRGTDPQYIAHPSTWLHQGRWDDDVSARPAAPTRSAVPEW